jgi:ketosteroid isomerase-like protein
MTTLPQTIATLVAAVNAQDTDRVLTTFAQDAVVNDAGRVFRGHDEIRQWSDKDNVAVKVVLTPTGTTIEDDVTVVSLQASGDFPGSPLPFIFRFRPADDDFTTIAELTIALAD